MAHGHRADPDGRRICRVALAADGDAETGARPAERLRDLERGAAVDLQPAKFVAPISRRRTADHRREYRTRHPRADAEALRSRVGPSGQRAWRARGLFAAADHR